MDIFLLVFVIFVVVAALAANTQLLLHFQQPEDSQFTQSVLVKGIIVVSLTVAWLVNLLLPVDVRNSRPKPGALDMELIWSLAFGVLAAFLVLIVPGTMFYYEAEGDTVIKRKRGHVLCNLLVVLLFCICAVVISYAFLAYADIPFQEYSCGTWLEGDRGTPVLDSSLFCGTSSTAEIEVRVGFHIYSIAALCWIGWWFFVLFGGIGLSSLPLDLIIAFRDRPRPIDEREFQRRREHLGQAAMGLLRKAEGLRERDVELQGKTGWRDRRSRRTLTTEYNKFKADVHLIEDEFERLQISRYKQGESILVSVSKLILGIIFAILSLTWVLHILLYVAPHGARAGKFLNGILTLTEGSGLYPLGVSIFAAFNLYLLACVVGGCLKFGMRVFFLFAIHPMRYKATPLNSILFNVMLILISSAAVVQFSQTAFADYARMTDADVIFAAQVKYLRFYRFFFENHVFIWTLLGWWLLTLIYLLIKPKVDSEISFSKKTDKKISKMGAGAAPPPQPTAVA